MVASSWSWARRERSIRQTMRALLDASSLPSVGSMSARVGPSSRRAQENLPVIYTFTRPFCGQNIPSPFPRRKKTAPRFERPRGIRLNLVSTSFLTPVRIYVTNLPRFRIESFWRTAGIKVLIRSTFASIVKVCFGSLVGDNYKTRWYFWDLEKITSRVEN